MALRITLGQYYPADSPIHRLDPRAKVLCAVVAMVSVFLIQTPAQLALGIAAMLATLAASRVPAGKVLQSIRPLVIVLALLGIFNLFFVQTGAALATLGPVRVTADGLWWAICYPLRFSVAISYGAIMLLTTTPTQLTDAFDAALAPLTRLGLPGHELAMVFSLMLRFIPTIAEEAGSIMDAQASRGGDLQTGSPAHRIRGIGAVLVALLASTSRHADGLALALDARCYVGGAERSHWHPLRFGARDVSACCLTVVYLVALVLVG